MPTKIFCLALGAMLGALLIIKPAYAESPPDFIHRLLEKAVERDIAEQTSRYLDAALVLVVDAYPDHASAAINYAKSLTPGRTAEIDQIIAARFPDGDSLGTIAATNEAASAQIAATAAKKPKNGNGPVSSRFKNGELAPGSFFGFSGWEGEVELGGKLNSGNTDQQSIDTSFEVHRENATWRHELHMEFDWTNTNDNTTRQRVIADYQLDYYLGKRSYVYGLTAYEDDRFSGFDYRLLVSAGIGYRLLDGESYFLDVEAGPTGRRSKDAITGDEQGELGGRLNAILEWAVMDNIVFENQASALVMDDSTTINTSTGFKIGITDSLSGRVKFDYEHNSEVPVGRKKSSTKTGVTLIYGF